MFVHAFYVRWKSLPECITYLNCLERNCRSSKFRIGCHVSEAKVLLSGQSDSGVIFVWLQGLWHAMGAGSRLGSAQGMERDVRGLEHSLPERSACEI